jgi:cellulose synthase/poly-beta-1,6-N-acetylglucosamine synthase-like glycosyltransferase
VTWIDLVFICYLAAMNSVQSLFIFLAMAEVLQQKAARLPELDNAVLSSSSTPPITIIAPAYNEQANIEDSVRAFLQVEYPSLTLLVVNDGSKDGTLAKLKERFVLVPTDLVVRSDMRTKPIRGIYQSQVDERLLVVDKENGGKADALNVGLNAARTPLVCCVDADSVIDQRALLRMIEPFLYDDGSVVAVGGSVLVANGSRIRDGIVEATALPRSWLARFQIVEYLRAFDFARMGFNKLGGNLIISGAFGLFLREAVIAAGGYKADTVGEDAELVVRLHHVMRDRKKAYRVKHISDAVCYTEAPEVLNVLGKQRDRWQRGLLDTLVRHRDMIFRPRYGMVGLVSLPIYVVFELLGPFVELAGYAWFLRAVAMGEVDRPFAILFMLMAFLWGFLLSVQSLVLDVMDRPGRRGIVQQLQLALVAIVECFGYRQMTLWFRVRGVWKFLAGEKSWGDMKRRGLAQQPAKPAAPAAPGRAT